MRLSDLSPAELDRLDTALHEAGHCVAAVIAGGRIVEARINDGDLETPGHCLHVDVPDGRQREVAYAGPWAATRWLHGERPALSAIIAGLRDNRNDWDEVVRSDAGLPREIENTLEGVWPAITALAKRLYVDGKVGHDAVLAALGMNGDGQHDNSVRASIRFGDWSPDATWSMPGSGNWRDAERAG